VIAWREGLILTETLDPVAKQTSDTQELAQQLLEQARTDGVDLIGPDGLLNQLTKTVLETASARSPTHSWSTRSTSHPGDQLHPVSAGLIHQLLRELLLINLSRHGLDRLGHYRSFPAKPVGSACRGQLHRYANTPAGLQTSSSGLDRPSMAG
jgi:hypothetical protein